MLGLGVIGGSVANSGLAAARGAQTSTDMLYSAVGSNLTLANQIAFRAALACRCIEKVDGFDGVITLNMMRALKPADWRIIAKAVDDMEAAGNA